MQPRTPTRSLASYQAKGLATSNPACTKKLDRQPGPGTHWHRSLRHHGGALVLAGCHPAVLQLLLLHAPSCAALATDSALSSPACCCLSAATRFSWCVDGKSPGDAASRPCSIHSLTKTVAGWLSLRRGCSTARLVGCKQHDGYCCCYCCSRCCWRACWCRPHPAP